MSPFGGGYGGGVRNVFVSCETLPLTPSLRGETYYGIAMCSLREEDVNALLVMSPFGGGYGGGVPNVFVSYETFPPYPLVEG